jgi:hypothetical protein
MFHDSLGVLHDLQGVSDSPEIITEVINQQFRDLSFDVIHEDILPAKLSLIPLMPSYPMSGKES